MARRWVNARMWLNIDSDGKFYAELFETRSAADKARRRMKIRGRAVWVAVVEV